MDSGHWSGGDVVAREGGTHRVAASVDAITVGMQLRRAVLADQGPDRLLTVSERNAVNVRPLIAPGITVDVAITCEHDVADRRADRKHLQHARRCQIDNREP